MSWSDLFKIWKYATEEPDPITRQSRSRDIEGAGVADAQAIPDIRSDGGYLSGSRGSVIRLRDSTDFIDLSSVSNRQSRYKEYERLRTVAEIETALTVFADESCVTGDTLVATPFGYFPIAGLAKEKQPDDQFLVYCYDLQQGDITLGWAFHPRLVKRAATIKVILDNGTHFSCTADHRVLQRDGEWVEAGRLKDGDELMPFYRLKAEHQLTRQKANQFARVLTFKDGWKTERQFLDEWRMGRKSDTQEKLSKILRFVQSGLNTRQIAKIMGRAWPTLDEFIGNEGFSYTELNALNKKFHDRRRVLHVIDHGEKDVYDLSVKGHENFATNTTIFHNCQIGEHGHFFNIECKNKDIKEDLDFLFFHPKMLNMDRKLWNIAKNLYLRGDHFIELVIDPEEPKAGILKVQNLPADSMYRIETIKGKVLEFQQSKEGPDYQSLSRVEVTKATPADLAQATAIRFTQSQIIHLKIGDDRQTYYPYGVSLMDAARGPAHQLKLMEDSMLVYRLCLVGETQVRTDNGVRSIANVVSGDVVWTLHPSFGLVQSKVVYHTNNGVKRVFTVKTKHNEITGTSNHPILVRDQKEDTINYVEIKNIVPKQHQVINITQDVEVPTKIVRPKTDKMRLSKEQHEIYNLLRISDKKSLIIESLTELGLESNKKNIQKCWTFLVHKDCVSATTVMAEKLCDKFRLDKTKLLPCCRYQKNPERINLTEYVDEDFARLFGFLIGDGCLNYDKGSARLLFSTGEDDNLNEKYRALLEKFFGKVTFRQDKRRKKGIGDCQVCSRYSCDTFKGMGYVCGSHNKRIPSWVFTERKAIRKAFIQGLVDADGSKRGTKEKTWNSTIRLASAQLIRDIKELWQGLGLTSSNIKHFPPKKTNIGGKDVMSSDHWEIRISEKLLPKYDDILSVSPAGKEEVFDISVDNEAQNFVANGIVVHNSRAPERRVFYIDVGQLPPFKAEAFMDRMKDTLRKKKAFSNRGNVASGGASPVEERWTAPSQDEDFWIPLRPNSNTRVETLPGACLALDTKIPLLDGRTLTLQEIIGEYESGKTLWAYSCDPANGEVVPGPVTWAGVTRRDTQVVRVVLDNGESVVCTPDHKFPVIGKGDVEAKDLAIGESLIPFNTKLKKIRSNSTKYMQVYDAAKKEWVFVHRMVAEYFKGTKYECRKTAKGNPRVVHHQGLNRFNNKPENLVWVCAAGQAKLYNHKVIKIEWLDEHIDTGTLTIDGKEDLHNFHNFATMNVFVRNSNLGEIDDALYFRNKLFIALNFPKNYMAQEDSTVTKVTLSSVDVKFARLVERLQMSLADGLTEIAIRHLELRGFPNALYEDLNIKLTPPSHWRELSENEVVQVRFDRAMAMKGSMLFADLDILTKILKLPEDDAKEIVSRSTIQQLQQLKLQIMAQNPQLLGVAMPQQAGGAEMGTAPGGPNPALTGEEGQMPGTLPPPPGPGGPEPAGPGAPPAAPPGGGLMKKMGDGEGKSALDTYGQPQQAQGPALPDPDPEDVRKYDLDIFDYSKEIDEEELDDGELGA